jgi:hypothetical protein
LTKSCVRIVGLNNPYRYVDPDGNWVETAADVYSLQEGYRSYLNNLSKGNYRSAAVDTAGIVVDAISAAAPGLYVGAGLAIKASRKVKDVSVLYQKVDAAGKHLKYGITKNLASRYTKKELGGGRLKTLAEGARKDMLALERKLHSNLPIGPEEGQKMYRKLQKKKGLK